MQCRLELPLGGELDSRVERDRERGSLLGRPPRGLRGAVGRAARVGQSDDLPRLALDYAVVRVLEAREAVVVQADVSDDRGRQRPLRVEAPGLGDEMNSLELQRADRVGGAGIHLAREPDEALRLGQPLGDLVAGDLQQRRQGGGRRGAVLDLVGDRVHGGHLDGHRELPAFAVQDRSAAARQLDAALLLPLGTRAILRSMHDLELDQAPDDVPLH